MLVTPRSHKTKKRRRYTSPVSVKDVGSNPLKRRPGRAGARFLTAMSQLYAPAHQDTTNVTKARPRMRGLTVAALLGFGSLVFCAWRRNSAGRLALATGRRWAPATDVGLGTISGTVRVANAGRSRVEVELYLVVRQRTFNELGACTASSAQVCPNPATSASSSTSGHVVSADVRRCPSESR
jgi:hypothetical protein